MATTYQTATKGSNITYDQFAFGMGVADRITKEESQVWHEQYILEEPSAQKVWRLEWQHNYLMGKLKIGVKEADRILSQTRDERTRDHQLAYKRATEQFRDHIVRPEKSGSFKQKKITVAQVIAMFKQLDRAGKVEFKKSIG